LLALLLNVPARALVVCKSPFKNGNIEQVYALEAILIFKRLCAIFEFIRLLTNH